MSHGHNELDVSHTLTAHFLFSHFHTTTVADDTFITDTLVFTAMTFIILDRTKNALAELEFSRISSGEARPIEIFEKLLFVLFSFLKAILYIIEI